MKRLMGFSAYKRHLLVALMMALLTGCGFHLRGDWRLPASMTQTAISGSFSPALFAELQRNFSGASASLERKGESAAGTELRIFEDRMNQRVLSIGRTGKVQEYELYHIVRFDVVRGKDEELVPMQTITLTRDYLFEDINVIGASREEATLRTEMYRDMASQIMRRLQAQAG